MSKPINLKDEYDVIIVGAGPSGSRCAGILAEKGMDVVIFEKRAEIGAPKRCAEGIGLEALRRLGFNGRERFVTQYINGAYIFSPNGRKFVVDYGKPAGCVVERKVFDKFLAYQAAKCGARFYTKTEVVDVIREGGKIAGVVVDYEGETYEIRSRIVISAEGVEGKIARKAGINTTNALMNIDSGYQYEMANINLEDPMKLYFYIGNEVAPRGYIWIFPKGEHVANVGIGIGGNVEKTAKHYLDEWIADHPEMFSDASIIEENAGGIPVGGLLKNMVLDGFMVIGDAAHTVNPIHGGGMDEGTRAGEIAADVVAEAFKANDFSKEFLDDYNKLWWRERGRKLERVEKLRQVFERLDDEDMNFLAENLNAEDIIDFASGRNLKKLAKVMMKRPKLLKLVGILR